MTAEGPQPQRNVFSINYAQFDGTAVGDHASGRFGGAGMSTPEPAFFSITDCDIAVPVGFSPFVDWLLAEVSTGRHLYFTRHGRRVVGLSPADVLGSILAEPPDEDEDGEGGGLRPGPTPAEWAAWRRQQARARRRPPAEAGPESVLDEAIARGEIRPPAEPGWPEIIPELADLPSLSDALIAARERERGR